MSDNPHSQNQASEAPPPGGPGVTHGPHALTPQHMRTSSGLILGPAPAPDEILHHGPVSQTEPTRQGDATPEARR